METLMDQLSKTLMDLIGPGGGIQSLRLEEEWSGFSRRTEADVTIVLFPPDSEAGKAAAVARRLKGQPEDLAQLFYKGPNEIGGPEGKVWRVTDVQQIWGSDVEMRVSMVLYDKLMPSDWSPPPSPTVTTTDTAGNRTRYHKGFGGGTIAYKEVEEPL